MGQFNRYELMQQVSVAIVMLVSKMQFGDNGDANLYIGPHKSIMSRFLHLPTTTGSKVAPIYTVYYTRRDNRSHLLNVQSIVKTR